MALSRLRTVSDRDLHPGVWFLFPSIPCFSFSDILAGKEPDLESVYKGIRSQTDHPGCLVVPYLVKQNPNVKVRKKPRNFVTKRLTINVKVIHSIRDTPEKWIESSRETVFQSLSLTFRGYYELRELGYPDWAILFIVRGFARMSAPMIDVQFGSDVCVTLGKKGWRAAIAQMEAMFADDELMKKTYLGWIERIKKAVKPENLLIFNVKEGWVPVCDFLGLPIPAGDFPLIRETVVLKSEPFPNVNDTKEFQGRLRGVRIYLGMAKGAAYGVRLAAIAAIGCGVWRILKR